MSVFVDWPQWVNRDFPYMTVGVRNISAAADLGRLISFAKHYRSGGNELVDDSLHIAFFGTLCASVTAPDPDRICCFVSSSRDDFSHVPRQIRSSGRRLFPRSRRPGSSRTPPERLRSFEVGYSKCYHCDLFLHFQNRPFGWPARHVQASGPLDATIGAPMRVRTRLELGAGPTAPT